jgi:hypothetical protein
MPTPEKKTYYKYEIDYIAILNQLWQLYRSKRQQATTATGELSSIFFLIINLQ